MKDCISLLKTVYHKLWWQWQLVRSFPARRRMKRAILANLESVVRTAEEEEIYAFLKRNRLQTFPYSFACLYRTADVKVNVDADVQLKYVWHKDKRLYFKRGWSNDRIKRAYVALCREQHYGSPHCYTDNVFFVPRGSIVADVGSAEGIFALNCIEDCRHIYLFETDGGWIEALNATFAQWKNKITVVNRFVSDTDDSGNIRLDTYFSDREVNFVKADVEGAERFLLKGAQQIMERRGLRRIAIASYHCPDDADVLRQQLKEKGFDTRYTHGFMAFSGLGASQRPYLRRGVIQAEKRIGQ